MDHTSNMECTSLNNLQLRKGFVQRDYRKGTKIKFETNFPKELEGYLSPEEFTQFIEGLNDIYLMSERLEFCEGCLACLTAYLLYCCIKTNKQKYMDKAKEYIENQNELWRDKGIVAVDPMERGFRILEIQVNLGLPAIKDSEVS